MRQNSNKGTDIESINMRTISFVSPLSKEDFRVRYVKNTRTLEESKELIEEVFVGNTLNEDNLLDEDEKWNVYLINLEF